MCRSDSISLGPNDHAPDLELAELIARRPAGIVDPQIQAIRHERRAAPLSRGFVDAAHPWLRAVLGLGFVAFSANSTIFLGAEHLLWLFDRTKQITIGGFPDAYWYSTAAALILFVGEVATSEKYLRTYRLFLAPDVFYTSLGIFTGLSKALTQLVLAAMVALGTPNRAAAEWIGWFLAIPASIWVGYIIAKWGEVLLFGKRRRPRSKED